MKFWLVPVLLSVLLGTLSPHSLALTTADDVKSFTLDNGMKILVLEDHSIPNANMYLFWKVGSRNEAPGITGLSHFFEHMMFNGAKRYGPKMFDRTMEAAGGANNAYTTENTTVYTNWFPADALETIFELEADRIEHLKISKEMLESERGVVASERRTGLENSNFRAIWQEVKGAAFRAHPYSWPVIGHESDIQNWQLDDLVTFHKTFYAPNNAVVVIAGDVTLEQVKALSQQYFGPIPAQQPPRKIHTVEPKQTGERRVFVTKTSVSSTNMMLAYHVPNAHHEDWYALQLMTDIIGEGKSSRLYSNLIGEQQVASDVFTYLPESFDANLLYFYAIAAEGVSNAQLEKQLIAQINQIAESGVTQAELEKVKNRRLVDFYRTMATINGKANTIGSYELYFGDFQKLFDAPAAYNKITTEQIQAVAKRYLTRANRTVGILAAKETGV